MLDFNVVAPFTLVAALVPDMVKRGSGAIVNVSTMVASLRAAGNVGLRRVEGGA